jgi:NADPH-dependent 7-cyano-7-deazaguanine reductase QueF
MTLLNPTFDVLITKINYIKFHAFAASEKAKRPLQKFFKDNDHVHSFTEEALKKLINFCHKNKLSIYFNDTVRHRNERPED